MPSILSGFDSVQQALAAQQFALSITQRNVAKADDPYYTRQEVIYTGDEWEWARSGVQGISLTAVRQGYVDLQISRELQILAEHGAASEALSQIDSILNGSGAGLQQAISNFFNSFGLLSSSPEDIGLRQDVLSTANALCTEFHRLYQGIQRVQTSEDRELAYAVKEINSITAQIAVLNEKIRFAQAAHTEDEFTLRDSRQQLLEQLSGLIDLSYFETESGAVTVSTRQGATLVIEDHHTELELSASGSGDFRGVFLDGDEITAALESGKLGGVLKMRDDRIAGYLSSLDDLAAAIIERVNEQHALGQDLDGSVGGNLLLPFTEIIPGSNYGAARSMSVAIDDPRLIAAARIGAGAGNNENARLLAGIAEEALLGAVTAGEFYASLVYRIGVDEKTAEDGISTQKSVLDQLKNQRDAFSGVNLDEEAINIIKYQKAYQATARYAAVLEALSDEVLQLLGV